MSSVPDNGNALRYAGCRLVSIIMMNCIQTNFVAISPVGRFYGDFSSTEFSTDRSLSDYRISLPFRLETRSKLVKHEGTNSLCSSLKLS